MWTAGNCKCQGGFPEGTYLHGNFISHEQGKERETQNFYSFRMATGAGELLPLMAQSELDIALVPANVAAILYQRTEGGVLAVDINTLGVLYVVTGSREIRSVADLGGKTICLTGMGTTPEAALRYVLHTGMDAANRQRAERYIRSRQQGRTLIIATHI